MEFIDFAQPEAIYSATHDTYATLLIEQDSADELLSGKLMDTNVEMIRYSYDDRIQKESKILPKRWIE